MGELLMGERGAEYGGGWRIVRNLGDTGCSPESVGIVFDFVGKLVVSVGLAELDGWLCPLSPFTFSSALFHVRPVGSGSSGIVANFFRTCLSAGRRIGLLRNIFMPESIHSLTLLSSEKAVNAMIGAE